MHRSDSELDRLRSIPILARLDRTALRTLTQLMEEITIAPGDVVIERGGRQEAVVIIESGTAALEVDGAVVGPLAAGDVVGELGLVLRNPARATIRATTPLTVARLSYAQFDLVADRNPEMMRTIVTDLAFRLAQRAARDGSMSRPMVLATSAQLT